MPHDRGTDHHERERGRTQRRQSTLASVARSRAMRRENLQSRIAPRRPRLRSALVLVASAPPDAGLVASPGGDVRVNSISPGPTRTPIFAQAGGASAEDAERGIENVAAAFAALLPTVQAMPGMIHAEDMAAAVFLAPDEARFVNGHDLIRTIESNRFVTG